MPKGITWPDAIERRHFAGFPGEYGPGVVVPLEITGLSEDEAKVRIDAGNLPLEIVALKDEPLVEPEPADEPDKGGE